MSARARVYAKKKDVKELRFPHLVACGVFTLWQVQGGNAPGWRSQSWRDSMRPSVNILTNTEEHKPSNVFSRTSASSLWSQTLPEPKGANETLHMGTLVSGQGAKGKRLSIHTNPFFLSFTDTIQPPQVLKQLLPDKLPHDLSPKATPHPSTQTQKTKRSIPIRLSPVPYPHSGPVPGVLQSEGCPPHTLLYNSESGMLPSLDQ